MRDHTEVLQWLDLAETEQLVSPDTIWFNIDVKALYDSLNEDLVTEALKFAIAQCRPDWSQDRIDWILELVDLNNRSAVAKHGDTWYKQCKGRATGDVFSVDLANITVYYAFNKVIYSQYRENILKLMRFVDDGLCGFRGVRSPFSERLGQSFINELGFILMFHRVNRQLTDDYGLALTYNLYKPGEYCEFLDIRFKFDGTTLSTDLFRKPTDSDGFLHFSSAHPPHTFAAVVYSQAIRYRRIINTDAVLQERLDQLYRRFTKCGYPKKMLDDIFDKVRRSPRNIQYREKEPKPKCPVYWVTNFDPAHNAVKDFSTKVNTALQDSPTWKEYKQTPEIVKVVPRRSPNIKDLLFKRRALAHATQDKSNVSKPCTEPGEVKRGRKCAMCPFMSGKNFIMQNNVRHEIHGGNCQSKCVIYVASCKECNMKYVGKTINELRVRVSGHRNTFKSFQPRDDIEITDREALSAHAKGYHKLQDVTDFNNLFVWDIFRSVNNPSMLLTEEQQVINLLGTKHPLGLNIANPIGLTSYLIHRV